jgi:hypothetical protein
MLYLQRVIKYNNMNDTLANYVGMCGAKAIYITYVIVHEASMKDFVSICFLQKH